MDLPPIRETHVINDLDRGLVPMSMVEGAKVMLAHTRQRMDTGLERCMWPMSDFTARMDTDPKIVT